jgi:hypothetical protein
MFEFMTVSVVVGTPKHTKSGSQGQIKGFPREKPMLQARAISMQSQAMPKR